MTHKGTITLETERLILRRFDDSDFGALFAIMKKPEVMYAWEAGFHKHEAQKWLKNQYARYQKDGYGYFAVTLKGTGELIGQAGLMKSEVNDEKVTEIGYIFDNKYWGKGYALEAARACVELAFGEYGLDKLYATIRPGNAASVRLAEKLGMSKAGEYVKTYKDKEMLHAIYAMCNFDM
ncbi:MAG: GNAT family N-acetyltransferase [Oscillospiraceae bacterium]|jgi:RimJ/RimL family protein N-acetyltransferase|nr:GNAT family N-acetyltransferase [Oscillospiraceae bacterium]